MNTENPTTLGIYWLFIRYFICVTLSNYCRFLITKTMQAQLCGIVMVDRGKNNRVFA